MSLKHYTCNKTKTLSNGETRTYVCNIYKTVTHDRVGRPNVIIENEEEILIAYNECKNKAEVMRTFNISRYRLVKLINRHSLVSA
jgi:hypothetical protein